MLIQGLQIAEQFLGASADVRVRFRQQPPQGRSRRLRLADGQQRVQPGVVINVPVAVHALRAVAVRDDLGEHQPLALESRRRVHLRRQRQRSCIRPISRNPRRSTGSGRPAGIGERLPCLAAKRPGLRWAAREKRPRPDPPPAVVRSRKAGSSSCRPAGGVRPRPQPGPRAAGNPLTPGARGTRTRFVRGSRVSRGRVGAVRSPETRASTLAPRHLRPDTFEVRATITTPGPA